MCRYLTIIMAILIRLMDHVLIQGHSGDFLVNQMTVCFLYTLEVSRRHQCVKAGGGMTCPPRANPKTKLQELNGKSLATLTTGTSFYFNLILEI